MTETPATSPAEPEAAPPQPANVGSPRPSVAPLPVLGFWDRVRNHKVMQWTLAYAAGAYTLLHGTEMVVSAMRTPVCRTMVSTSNSRVQVGRRQP